jgi:hypothetical protein
MDNILDACCCELCKFFDNDKDLKKFLHLIKQLNSLPQVIKQSRPDSRCLYEAVARGLDTSFLEQTIEGFFSPLQKHAGVNLPLKFRFNKTVRMLRGIRKEQSFFLRATSAGEIYGALWPWQSEPENITIFLGLNGNSIKDDDYQQLEKLVDLVCSKKD